MPDVNVATLLDRVRDWELDAQPVRWSRYRWRRLEDGHAAVLNLIDREVEEHGTIRRSWLTTLSSSDPTTFLVAAMVWGYGNDRLGSYSLLTMLSNPGRTESTSTVLSEVITASRSSAADGFSSLFSSGRTRIARLGIAFGTKIVHFAGYEHAQRPRPLVYDLRVWTALQDVDGAPSLPTPRGQVSTVDYHRYCAWAEDVALEQNTEPARVEYALFLHGRRTR